MPTISELPADAPATPAVTVKPTYTEAERAALAKKLDDDLDAFMDEMAAKKVLFLARYSEKTGGYGIYLQFLSQ